MVISLICVCSCLTFQYKQKPHSIVRFRMRRAARTNDECQKLWKRITRGKEGDREREKKKVCVYLQNIESQAKAKKMHERREDETKIVVPCLIFFSSEFIENAHPYTRLGSIQRVFVRWSESTEKATLAVYRHLCCTRRLSHKIRMSVLCARVCMFAIELALYCGIV